MYTVERVSQIYLPMSDNDFIAAIRHDFPENSYRIEGIAAYVTMWDLPNLLFPFPGLTLTARFLCWAAVRSVPSGKWLELGVAHSPGR